MTLCDDINCDFPLPNTGAPPWIKWSALAMLLIFVLLMFATARCA